jgi:hypothetical protein
MNKRKPNERSHSERSIEGGAVNCLRNSRCKNTPSFGIRHERQSDAETRIHRLSSAIVEDGVGQELRVQPKDLHADET